jgi:hypothetical protein
MSANLPDRKEFFREDAGFEHANWDAIAQWIDRIFPEAEQDAAWAAAARMWLTRVQRRLGEDFQIAETKHFLLLSALDKRREKLTTDFLERGLWSIRGRLGELALRDALGKLVCILMRDQPTYCAYVSHFDPAVAEVPASGGTFIHAGYGHIVLPSDDVQTLRAALAHELAHSAVMHLPLPLWLNEGVAMLLEEAVSETSHYSLDRDLVARHRAYWTPATIQQFWSGASWRVVEDGNELSYSLAQILMRLFYEDVKPGPEKFRDFVGNASWEDGGQAAMCKHFGVSLGELAAVFLGDGDWEPRPAEWPELAAETPVESSAPTSSSSLSKSSR